MNERRAVLWLKGSLVSSDQTAAVSVVRDSIQDSVPRAVRLTAAALLMSGSLISLDRSKRTFPVE
ncbi:hypothetical protein ASF25_07845 [Methylobacterium sp. Leaf100]|nr:hypothetical protein ASF25_07845 [Methylobacterium sp. Leaf100]